MTGGEFEVGGQTYRWARLDARKQFHVARRLAPILSGIAKAIDGSAAVTLADVDLDAVAAAFAEMPDENADYVMNALLAATQRRAEGGAAWGNVMTPGGAMMFEDIDFSQMMQIVWKVLEGNLGGFFRALPSTSLTGAAPDPKDS